MCNLNNGVIKIKQKHVSKFGSLGDGLSVIVVNNLNLRQSEQNFVNFVVS